jgi:hypothetical protein
MTNPGTGRRRIGLRCRSKPILGGFNAPPLIHEFIPGPETITLPFTGMIGTERNGVFL